MLQKAAHHGFYALFASIVVLLGLVALWYVNDMTNTREYETLVMRVRSMASLFESTDITMLAGNESDLTNPAYMRLKEKLFALKSANSDLEFLYLMAKEGERVYFLVDSEDPLSEDYSPPGQTYDEASEELLSGWAPGIPYVLEVFEDRWGDWISALAPLKNESGKTIALLGLDKNAAEHRQVFYIQAGLVVLATSLILLLIGLLSHLHRKERELLEMKSDFVAAAAHELRAPLSGIRWALSSLRNDADISSTARKTVNEIYERVRGLVDMTNTFLLSASTDHGVMRPDDLKIADIAPALQEAVKHSLMIAQSKKIRIDVTFSLSDKIVVRADPARLRLVFENLLSNAIKYSPAGSTVTVAYQDQGPVRLFSVRDSGIGIPKADQKKIFDGYHRAGNARKAGILGSGFGLYMVKKIIDFHGGTIECVSSPDQGSTFTIMLPAGV